MWLAEDEIQGLGLAAWGSDVQIDPTVRLFGASSISIGSHVRIDSGVLLSAGPGALTIGSFVHIAADVKVFASAADVELRDFSGLSVGVCLLSATDDFTDGHLTGPTVPDRLRQVSSGRVVIGRHAVVGVGSVILPDVTLGDGCAVGSLSLVRNSVPEGCVVAGNPLRVIRKRDVQRLRLLEAALDEG